MQEQPRIIALKEKIALLPKEPGVYLFKDEKGNIIYIGKAKSLRSRVAQYFVGDKRLQEQSPKTAHLVSRIHTFDYFVVDSETESLLLENKLIKQHSPKYNISLKDDKTFSYIKVTDEKYPRIISTRKRTKKGVYFGPYTNGFARATLVKLLNETFKLRQEKHVCKKVCLNYHLNLCSGVCVGKISGEDYQTSVNAAIHVLKGHTKEISSLLHEQMHVASKEKNYELAKIKKEQKDALLVLEEKQHVQRQETKDQDVIAFVFEGKDVVVSIIHTRKGVIASKEVFRIEAKEEIMREFVTTYYGGHMIPREILSSDAFWSDEEEYHAITNYLQELRKGVVDVLVPKQGEKKSLVDLAAKNVQRGREALDQICSWLEIPSANIIECFDISNFGKVDLVSGMVRFVAGKPDKKGYRKFAIRSIVGKNDDFASMHEVITRRYSRLKQEVEEEKKAMRENKQSEKPKTEFPNLIVVDGGAGQVSAAFDALRKLRLDIPLVGLAKREEELYLPDREKPLQYDKNSPGMLLLRNIRDNVHRFAITYNRKKRKLAVE